MTEVLERSYGWRTRLVVSAAAAAGCVLLLGRSDLLGWGTVAWCVVGLWMAYAVLVWTRTRAYLAVDGDRLTIRSVGRRATVAASEVVAVKQFLTPRGPSYRLRLSGPGPGGVRTVVVPAARLRRGHSTLFAWILTRAPQAELDAGSRRTVEQLQIKGLLP